MQLHLTLDIPQLEKPISYRDSILLVGSCFTENMTDRLQQHKFRCLSNPHGILFNPMSVADSIESYITGRTYTDKDLFYYNELWNSWDHHTRFSNINQEPALNNINESQIHAATFIKQADVVVFTLGSAFQYFLKENGKHVANNHRAPAQWFEKRLLETSLITELLSDVIKKLHQANPFVQVILTISPVRHIRDGVVDNNRSKARLIEAVHTICGSIDYVKYFPAYEIVIDILRDYRYYDVDFVHPNYLSTTYVWEQFVQSSMSAETQTVMKEVHEIMTARWHKPRFPQTDAHKNFMKSYSLKTQNIISAHPYINLQEELNYFSENQLSNHATK